MGAEDMAQQDETDFLSSKKYINLFMHLVSH